MPRFPDLPCADCGEMMWRSASSAPEGVARCLPCRRATIGTHGTHYAYRTRGCRCEVCVSAASQRSREYSAMVKARDGLTPTQKIRGVVAPAACTTCATPIFRARLDKPQCAQCHKRAKRSVHIRPADRRAIYERDSWVCQICSESVEPDLPNSSPWQATLDHITPRSKGGPDDPSNLRLAHRYCNTIRSNSDALTLEELTK